MELKYSNRTVSYTSDTLYSRHSDPTIVYLFLHAYTRMLLHVGYLKRQFSVKIEKTKHIQLCTAIITCIPPAKIVHTHTSVQMWYTLCDGLDAASLDYDYKLSPKKPTG